MTQKRSRKKTKTRSGEVKKPELRKPQVLADGTPKPKRSVRNQTEVREQKKGPALQVRPDSRSGLVVLALGGWLLTALVLEGGLLLRRWYTFGFPDSLWLYVAFGMFTAAPAVGYVARRRADVDFWVIQAGLVALAALVIERVLAPSCPAGADCGAFGAMGSVGLPISVLLVLILTGASRYLGRFMLDWVGTRRPRGGRTSAGITLRAMLLIGLGVGSPIAITLIAGDALIREEPALAVAAEQDVREFCFGIAEEDPQLAVRPAPEAISSFWTSYVVRRADEDRPGIKQHPLPKRWLSQTETYPYEAVVAYDAKGGQSFLECRKVSPTGGVVDKADVKQPDYGAESPIKPKELLQSPGGGTPLAPQPG